MKILIITPRVPFPPHRGDKLKIFNLVNFLRKNHQVKVLTFSQGEEDKKNVRELENIGVDISQVNLPLVKSVISVLLAVFSKIPFQSAYFKSSSMSDLISSELKKEKYDFVYFHLIRSAQYEKLFNGVRLKKVIDFTDAVSLYLARYIRVIKNPLRKLFFYWELKRIEKYESVGGNFDKVYVCSETDRQYLSKRINTDKINIISNGVDLSTFTPIKIPKEKNRIIFTGNMPYFPNYDAVDYFVKDIYPDILKEIPDSKFYVVGQKPPKFIKNLENDNIIVTGFVDDIRAEYMKSTVNIAPIRFGAGTLNKIIESLVLGIPVVASSLSVAGMTEELKKFVNVAENEKEFADKVIEILKNPEKYSKMLIDSREEIISILDWNNILKKFEDEITDLVNER